MPRATIDLQEAYGLDYTKGVRTIGQDMNLAAAQALFPTFYTRMTTRGPIFKNQVLTPTEFLQLSWFDACWGEAVWSGLGGGQNITTGYLNSQNGVIVPKGYYWQKIPAEFSSGAYWAGGTGFVSDIPGSGNDANNTRFAPWHEAWLGNPIQRDIFVSGSWGVGGNSGYVEGTKFYNGWRFDGRQDASSAIISDTFFSTALRHWKPGEVTSIYDAWAENYRTRGFEYFGATPSFIGNISAFQCVQAGLGLAGSWGATMNIGILSSDACGAMFDMYPLAGAEQGGTINIGAIKNETMVASAGRSFRGQVIGVLRGQFAVNIGAVSGAVGGGLLPALFIADSRLSNGNLQRGHLRIGSMKGFNFQHILHDIRTGRAFPKVGDYQAHSFEFDSVGTNGNSIAWQTGSQPITPVTGLAQYRVMHQVGSLTPINMAASANPPIYREIITGPPAFGTITYLDGTPPPPPGPSVPTFITVSLAETTITGPGTVQASAVVTDQFGNTLTNAGTWSVVSGPGAIDSNGLITANGTAGAIVVRYSQGSVVGEATLTATAVATSVPTTVTVTLSAGTITVPATAQATAEVRDQFNNLMPLTGTWSIVSGPASISQSGVVTPTGTAGTAVVRYTQGSVNGSANLTIQAAVTPPPPPVTPLYSVTFAGLNPLALPGCVAIPASQPWRAGTITGSVYSTRFQGTAINTRQVFTTPVAGVKRIVLKNAVVREAIEAKWLNNDVRTNANRQWTGASLSLVISPFVPNAPAADIEIILPTAQTMETLFGALNAANTLWIECTGVQFWAQ